MYKLKNLEMGGSLQRKLKLYRKNGMSFRDISARLSVDGTSVSRTTVDKWTKRLGIE
jgi:transposase-like protein